MNHKEYNGWHNYETWAVALWMDNEQGSHNYWGDRAQEAYDEAEAGSSYSSQTREQAALIALSDMLKAEHEEAMPELGASIWADLLGAAMSEVNWYEIAEHLMENVDKEEEAQEEAEA